MRLKLYCANDFYSMLCTGVAVFLSASVGFAQNIAPVGVADLGNTADVTMQGVSDFQAGVAANVNDEDTATGVNTWTGADSAEFDWVQITYPTLVDISSATLVMNAFGDGGWFGQGGTNTVNLIAPDVQVTVDSGTTWTTIPSTTDYLTTMTGVVAGSGETPLSTFNFTEQTSVNGIRLIGSAGGTASNGTPGFIAIREMEVIGNLLSVLPVLDIDTSTGEISLTTGLGAPMPILGYSITSDEDVGELDETAWVSIAGNQDASGPGPIDPNDDWLRLSAPGSTTDLSEAELVGGDGGMLPASLSLSLGNSWIQNPFGENLRMEMLLTDGTVFEVDVTYDGQPTNPIEFGDMNFDGSIDSLDWPTVRDSFNATLDPELSRSQVYALGDLNNDGVNDEIDLGLFKIAFEAANGPGSFSAMVNSVPEPSCLLLLAISGLVLSGTRHRRECTIRFNG